MGFFYECKAGNQLRVLFIVISIELIGSAFPIS
jgi:hypothetical protein